MESTRGMGKFSAFGGACVLPRSESKVEMHGMLVSGATLQCAVTGVAMRNLYGDREELRGE